MDHGHSTLPRSHQNRIRCLQCSSFRALVVGNYRPVVVCGLCPTSLPPTPQSNLAFPTASLAGSLRGTPSGQRPEPSGEHHCAALTDCSCSTVTSLLPCTTTPAARYHKLVKPTLAQHTSSKSWHWLMLAAGGPRPGAGAELTAYELSQFSLQ